MAAHYDVVIVGGGTAGSVIASRLSENPARSVAVIEGGPTDVGNDKVLAVRRWQELLGSELDYDYPTTEQPRGNSFIRHSRAKVLGGCSSHNTLISFRPQPSDWDEWEAAGATGWGHAAMDKYYARLENHIAPVAESDRNPVARDFVTAASTKLGVPEIADFNAAPFVDGAGFFNVAYHPETGKRSSASVAYLHEHLDRPNLHLLLSTWAYRVEFDAAMRATGVLVRRADGTLDEVTGERIVLAAGAVDTPRLLMLSGVGPAGDLRGLGIDPLLDLPGVGENLQDHPESVIIWETAKLPENSAMDSDAGLFLRRNPDSPVADLMYHFYQVPFGVNAERLGYTMPEYGVCMTPNVPKARSRGRLYLTSADPDVKPALDFRYFTDPDGHDEQTVLEGLRTAREVAASEPLRSWLLREVAPGPDVTSDAALSEYGRRVAHTVYHPAGTCAMGGDGNPLAVCDPALNVRGTINLTVADASVFPTMPVANPMVPVLMIGERVADMLR